MKTLIVEDDFTCRILLQNILLPYGEVHIAVNGYEALKAVGDSMNIGEPYDLVCIDIVLPIIDGHSLVRGIRSLEQIASVNTNSRVKIIMTTMLDLVSEVVRAKHEGCDDYLVKPIDGQVLVAHLKKLQLI